MNALVVRPIFYYNDLKRVGDRLGLHLFEPRFKEMVRRIWTLEHLPKEFLYLPNFSTYQATAGDLGLIARLDDVTIFPDGRASLSATLVRWAVVRHHWIENYTHGLHFAAVSLLDTPPPPLSTPPPAP